MKQLKRQTAAFSVRARRTLFYPAACLVATIYRRLQKDLTIFRATPWFVISTVLVLRYGQQKLETLGIGVKSSSLLLRYCYATFIVSDTQMGPSGVIVTNFPAPPLSLSLSLVLILNIYYFILEEILNMSHLQTTTTSFSVVLCCIFSLWYVNSSFSIGDK